MLVDPFGKFVLVGKKAEVKAKLNADRSFDFL